MTQTRKVIEALLFVMEASVRSGTAGAGRVSLACLATAALAALPVLSGCSAGADPAAAGATHDTHGTHGSGGSTPTGAEPTSGSSHAAVDGTVIQPGRPGEKAETLPPDATLPAGRHNAADVRFVQMMIPHHAQALEMGELARTRANDPQVKALAQRIADAQGAEILAMSAWLQRHGIKAPTAEDLQKQAHHGGTMPGMLSGAEMDRLAAADGRRFDALFLRFMIGHHRGAVDMAGQAMERGRDIVVGEMAADVAAGQAAEITRMQRMLRRP